MMSTSPRSLPEARHHAYRLHRNVVALEAVGFLTVATISWLNELWDIPRYLFGAPATPFRPHEALLESGLVLVLGAAIMLATIRVFRHVAVLESMIVLCAWCRRARLDEAWVSVEAFLRGHHADTSHGMCPDCATQFDRDSVQPGASGNT